MKKNIFIKIPIIIIFVLLSLLFSFSCNNSTNDNNNDNNNNNPLHFNSYIWYNTISGSKEINLPYCAENIRALCKVSSDSYYYIRTDINDLTKISIIVHSRITGIHFGSDWDEMTIAPDFFCAFMFAENSNIISECNLPKNIVETSDHFCESMFESCLTLTKYNFDLLLPTNLHTVGNYFCYKMFCNCTNLCTFRNDDFTIPASITSIRNYFCGLMFSGCISLINIPLNFSFPSSITSSSISYFCYKMFENCHTLGTEMNVNNKLELFLTIPQSNSAYTYFCSEMFLNADKIEKYYTKTPLPHEKISILRDYKTNDKTDSLISYVHNGENNIIPFPFYGGNVAFVLCGGYNKADLIVHTNLDDLNEQVIIKHSELNGIWFGSDWDVFTYAPANFCRELFEDNSNELLFLNMPSNITEVADCFCYRMFKNYHSNTLPSNFTLPTKITQYDLCFCQEMFVGSWINSIPSQFNLPKTFSDTTTHTYCFESMFKNCVNLKFGYNEVNDFKIMGVPLETIYNRTYAVNMFYGCTHLNANSIPNTPPSPINNSYYYSIARN